MMLAIGPRCDGVAAPAGGSGGAGAGAVAAGTLARLTGLPASVAVPATGTGPCCVAVAASAVVLDGFAADLAGAPDRALLDGAGAAAPLDADARLVAARLDGVVAGAAWLVWLVWPVWPSAGALD
jgi:hypothetical protein